MADQIHFEVKAAAVQKALKDLAGTQAVRDALNALGRVLVERIRLGFRTSTDPYGVPWPPLVLRAGQPLVDTGLLRKSIGYRVLDDRSIEIGTNVQYAPVQQFGAVIKPIKGKYLRVPFKGSAGGQSPIGYLFLKKAVIPARRFMPIEGGQVVLPGSWAASALSAMERALTIP
jgi:phage gpG-like protein